MTVKSWNGCLTLARTNIGNAATHILVPGITWPDSWDVSGRWPCPRCIRMTRWPMLTFSAGSTAGLHNWWLVEWGMVLRTGRVLWGLAHTLAGRVCACMCRTGAPRWRVGALRSGLPSHGSQQLIDIRPIKTTTTCNSHANSNVHPW